ncbi:hypothetical protein [Alteromonas oceanisediminis]|uniref:hypothetical protein n=1 Tax=Alteromonas oceanisediminis TaxID=2836180 RepID=UPI001BDAB719|nr:hypothetical protein [Alteromonas oceanisediminis]MBT0587387.1 hypothetical protein [Alteromonas oceanisediminis]
MENFTHRIVDEEVKFGRDEELVSVTDTRGVIEFGDPDINSGRAAKCGIEGYQPFHCKH